jgi:hypothetical protein
MIELLVKRFEDAGYIVQVMPRALRITLRISKIVDGEELIVYWSIAQDELEFNQILIEALLGRTERYIYDLKCEEEMRKRNKKKSMITPKELLTLRELVDDLVGMRELAIKYRTIAIEAYYAEPLKNDPFSDLNKKWKQLDQQAVLAGIDIRPLQGNEE